MDTSKPLVNRVSQSALITLDLETFFPRQEDIAGIDLKDFLFKGLILREAEFREAVKNINWNAYANKYVTIYCSTNAIIPVWAYMLLSANLCNVATDVACSNLKDAAEIFLYRNIARMDMEPYNNQRIVVKGCGDRTIPEAAFVQITQQLGRVARSVMYGEPCSTVPVFKKSTD
jgi:hypothetical protein